VQRDELGNRIISSPHSQLLKLANNDRFISSTKTKPTTIKSERCYPTAGILASTAGCPVKVIGTWNGQGVDDLIAAHGQGVYLQAYQTAATLDTWKPSP